MDIFEAPIDPDQYRIQSSEFESLGEDSRITEKLELLSISTGHDDRRYHRNLAGFTEDRTQQIVYTFALEQSNHPESTIPIFEINLREFATYEDANLDQISADDPMSAYREYVRALFVEEDKHGRIQGLGPIGKSLKLSQEMEVILFIKGIDRVPNKTQSAFFQLLESPPSMQFVQTLEGDQKNLTFFTTTTPNRDLKDIEGKMRSLLGGSILKDMV